MKKNGLSAPPEDIGQLAPVPQPVSAKRHRVTAVFAKVDQANDNQRNKDNRQARAEADCKTPVDRTTKVKTSDHETSTQRCQTTDRDQVCQHQRVSSLILTSVQKRRASYTQQVPYACWLQTRLTKEKSSARFRHQFWRRVKVTKTAFIG